MDAPCPVLGRPASDGECGTTILAATPDQMARCRQCDRGIALMASVRRKPSDLLTPSYKSTRPAVGTAPRALKDYPTPAASAAEPASQTAQAPATRKAPKEAPMANYGKCKQCGAKNRALPCRGLCSRCYAAFRELKKKWLALGNTGDPAPDFTGEDTAPDTAADAAPIPTLGQQAGQGAQAEAGQLPGSECADDAQQPDLDGLSRVLGVPADTLAQEMGLAVPVPLVDHVRVIVDGQDVGSLEEWKAQNDACAMGDTEGGAAASFAGDYDPADDGRLARKPDEDAENKAMSDALAAAANGGPSVYHLTGERFDRAAEAAAFASAKAAIAEEAAVTATVAPTDIPALETALSSITDKVAARMAEQDQPTQASATVPPTGGQVLIGGRLFAPLVAEGRVSKPSLTVYRKRCRLNLAALRALGAQDLERGYVSLYWSEEQAQLALRILPAQANGALHLRYAKPINKGAEFSTPVIARKLALDDAEKASFNLAVQDGFLLAGAPVTDGAAKAGG
ncbi:hypothetical protein FVW20_00600 [Desulfovibrio oxamicus]|uniref:Uncharacterized protein n=1 Tax=Nitratidesulfovibrio oxamicus TaxID=32016 RepID=A0ABS0J081_9BACT|nr:hypothetical protein [Nitratidesulfovibrio oxamicus]MBG3875562.1 hypothetical protein [Nitratidesulfovibrio oxamicus]